MFYILFIYKIFFTNEKLPNLLLLNVVPGSILILCRIPCRARYSAKNSKILTVVGLVRNRASGHPELLSLETNIYFFPLGALWKGPATSNEISSFGFSSLGSSANSF